MSEKKQKQTITEWIDYRLPIFSFFQHLGEYRTPKNLSYFWNFGSLAGIALVIQIVTGIFLSMHYTAHVDHAFDSVENIMRNVNYGWLLRYTHAVGASMFFIVVYIHIARGMFYGSYKYPRELLWFLGIIIFLMMMASAFIGYVLPWGQMSLWGATVITNLFSAIPLVGEDVVIWLWGGYSVDNPTLNRFFSLHYLLPLVLVAVVILHIISLHNFGSNNPAGVDVKSKEKDTISFHPYYTYKDLFGLGVFLIVFSLFVFYAPNYLGHPDNYIPADPLVTPAHIVPEWYFLPFYAILRAVPSKLGGVILMFSAIIVWFFLPWLDSHKARSGEYRPWFRKLYWVFLVDVIALGYIGAKPAEGIYITLGAIFTIYYFVHFLVILPFLSYYEKHETLPESIDADYKAKHL